MDELWKIEIITRPEKLETLKAAMYDIRVTGMTVSQVYGCGLSEGYTEVYRGKEMYVNLLPKIKVEIVVCEVPVEKVVDVAKQVCCTGNIGDGKIFVYPIANAIRIRTGEEGPAAVVDRWEERRLVNETVLRHKATE